MRELFEGQNLLEESEWERTEQAGAELSQAQASFPAKH